MFQKSYLFFRQLMLFSWIFVWLQTNSSRLRAQGFWNILLLNIYLSLYLSPSIYLSLSLSPLYLTMLLVLMLIWMKVTLSSARRSLLLYYSIIFPRCKLVWNFNHLPHLLPVSLSYFHFFHHLFSFFLWLSKGIFIASFNDNSNYWHISCLHRLCCHHPGDLSF